MSPDPSSHHARISRRTVLQIGSLALGNLTLADCLRCRAEAAQPVDTAVIHVFMGGGPSQIDLYDLKPGAPAEIRGEFLPVSTSVPGVQICEHLPHLASALKYLTIVRSVAHLEPGHLPASHWMMTGHRPPPSTTRNVNPSCGSIVAQARGANVQGLPAYVSIPRRQLLGAAAFLGAAYNPFTIESDPNSAQYKVRNLNFPSDMTVARLEDRTDLLHKLDRLRHDSDRAGEFLALDKFSRQAIEMVSGPHAQKAFDLSQEPTATRELYGRTSAGQGCLLARRLVEAGVTFVTVLSGGEWDTHVDNFTTLKNKSLPPVDRALAALVTDLYQRHLDRHVLLLVSGEFGRTPKINPQAGRDHWPGAFSVLFAGGGMNVGRTIGATDSQGMYPVTHPFSPGDVLATVYNFLGINTARVFPDSMGRPVPILSEGKPIAELWS
ncbi:MAG TPA: DUF1501 domain-containing protein [Pirellulales bacterium]|jgi:hypothetical protein